MVTLLNYHMILRFVIITENHVFIENVCERGWGIKHNLLRKKEKPLIKKVALKFP